MVEYVIDGSKVTSLEAFYEEISRSVIPGFEWGRNLDAFNDILRGGFGTPDEGFTLRWSDAEVSRQNLGYAETVRQLELRLRECHPSNRELVSAKLADARMGVGPTVFDWLIEIIEVHGPGGEEAHNNVRLLLD